MKVLEERLRNRATETEEQVAIRVAAARREILESPWYDYIVVNDDLQEAIEDLKAILQAGRSSRTAEAARLRSFLMSFTCSDALTLLNEKDSSLRARNLDFRSKSRGETLLAGELAAGELVLSRSDSRGLESRSLRKARDTGHPYRRPRAHCGTGGPRAPPGRGPEDIGVPLR